MQRVKKVYSSLDETTFRSVLAIISEVKATKTKDFCLIRSTTAWKKKYLQHSWAFSADEASYSYIDVGGTPLLTIETFLILRHTTLDLPEYNSKG